MTHCPAFVSKLGAIAEELCIAATQTVCNYISTVYDKLGVHIRAETIV